MLFSHYPAVMRSMANFFHLSLTGWIISLLRGVRGVSFYSLLTHLAYFSLHFRSPADVLYFSYRGCFHQLQLLIITQDKRNQLSSTHTPSLSDTPLKRGLRYALI